MISEYLTFMDTSLICNTNALGETQGQRYKELAGNLNQSRESAKELNDGYAFRFKAKSQLILDAAEFIGCERLCCPFFNFELAVETDTNRLWFSLWGQNGIKDFIRAEYRIEE
jgi:hypothetical protein